MHKGQLKSWNGKKGFGFIKSDDIEENTFIHISTLKAMSRKPKVGDIIYFELENQANGKTRAVNCSIEGVDTKSGTTATPSTEAAPKASTPSSKVVPILILTLAVIAVAAFIY